DLATARCHPRGHGSRPRNGDHRPHALVPGRGTAVRDRLHDLCDHLGRHPRGRALVARRPRAREGRGAEPLRLGARPRAALTTMESRMPGARVSARGWGWRHAGRDDWAVRDLDLAIEPGERVLLLGASGAG